MSYGRAPNLTHYLRNLNTPEAPVDETPFTDDDLAKELAPFLNTQFLDFETGQNTDFQAPPVKPDVARAPSSAEDVLTPTDTLLDDFSPNMDFMTGETAHSGFCLSFFAHFLLTPELFIFFYVSWCSAFHSVHAPGVPPCKCWRRGRITVTEGPKV
jgi:hypothetical protein